MSSGIKLQSLIRKLKNNTKEQIDKRKVITDYSFKLNTNDLELDTSSIFQFRLEEQHVYDFEQLSIKLNKQYTTSTPIAIPIKSDNQITRSFDQITGSFDPSEVNNYLGVNMRDHSQTGHSQKGYLHNIYNAEQADEEWAIFIFCINKIYANFISSDKIKIKSLHVNNTESILTAFNHFLFNSNIGTSVEWSWLNTISLNPNSLSNGSQSPKNSLSKFYKTKKKYKSKMLYLLDKHIYSINNINFIVNETNAKLSKINFLIINEMSSGQLRNNPLENINKINNKSYISYIVLAIKLMELTSLTYIKIPNIKDWDTGFINVLLLYSMIFSEVYVYKFYLTSLSTYLICKNRKKINNESIYKKLIFIISNESFTNNHNLFCKTLFETPTVKQWLNTILDIIDDDSNSDGNTNTISFQKVLSSFNVLNMNTNTFL